MPLLFMVMGALSASPDASTSDKRTAGGSVMILTMSSRAGSAPGLRPRCSPVSDIGFADVTSHETDDQGVT
jgi:hypothetical protein